MAGKAVSASWHTPRQDSVTIAAQHLAGHNRGGDLLPRGLRILDASAHCAGQVMHLLFLESCAAQLVHIVR
jgi:hypothetical protein